MAKTLHFLPQAIATLGVLMSCFLVWRFSGSMGDDFSELSRSTGIAYALARFYSISTPGLKACYFLAIIGDALALWFAWIFCLGWIVRFVFKEVQRIKAESSTEP